MTLKFHRINVIGPSGSGKSTFSRQLASTLGVEYIEMDSIHWQPNWNHLNDDDFNLALKDRLAGDAWVLDGNYSRTRPVKWQNVECVIWLNLSFFRTTRQIISRSIRRAIDKQELWPGTGNTESWRQSFWSRDSVILWSVQSYKRHAARFKTYTTDPALSHITFIRLGSPLEVRQFLAKMRKTT